MVKIGQDVEVKATYYLDMEVLCLAQRTIVLSTRASADGAADVFRGKDHITDNYLGAGLYDCNEMVEKCGRCVGDDKRPCDLSYLVSSDLTPQTNLPKDTLPPS